MAFDRYEILKKHYKNEIKLWDWKGIKKDITTDCFVNENDEIEEVNEDEIIELTDVVE